MYLFYEQMHITEVNYTTFQLAIYLFNKPLKEVSITHMVISIIAAAATAAKNNLFSVYLLLEVATFWVQIEFHRLILLKPTM